MSVIAANLNTNLQGMYKAPVKSYVPKKTYSSGKVSTRALNGKLSISKSIASNASYNAAMQRIIVANKIWEDFLEKLRKAGGGGGGSMRRIDKVAVSMMMTNFLSDKAMKALMQNLNIDFLKQLAIANDKITQSPMFNFASGIANSFANMFAGLMASVFSSPVMKGAGNTSSNFAKGLSSIAAAFSFQMNKLKELLEKELEEAVKKLDFKEKLRRLKEKMTDFFVELKDEALILIELIKSKFLKAYLPSFLRSFSL